MENPASSNDAAPSASQNVAQSSNDFVEVTSDPIHIDRVTRLVTTPEAGAVATFSGTTRDNFQGRQVIKLEYEAYAPMAIKEMHKICLKLRKRWELLKIAIIHRIGTVPLAETSVLIAVSSAHRREALDAVSFAIDELKATVPIWKREFYADGSESVWKENSECFFHASPHQHA